MKTYTTTLESTGSKQWLKVRMDGMEIAKFNMQGKTHTERQSCQRAMTNFLFTLQRAKR